MAVAFVLRGLAAAALLGATSFAHAVSPASGGLVVTPTRVVLVGDGAGAKLVVRNTSAGASTYRISLVRMRMGERGTMSLVDDARSGELFADGLVRFSPAVLTLAPGVDRAVRLKARLPEGARPGEYRSHLLFRPVTAPDEVAREDGAADDGDRAAPLVGVTVPVIVRIGDVSAAVRITSLTVLGTGEATRLEVALERSGNASVYGDLAVRVESDGARSELVGGLGGLAVYVPNERRVVEIPLRLPEAMPAGERRLRVEYRSAGEDGALLAEREAALPPR